MGQKATNYDNSDKTEVVWIIDKNKVISLPQLIGTLETMKKFLKNKKCFISCYYEDYKISTIAEYYNLIVVRVNDDTNSCGNILADCMITLNTMFKLHNKCNTHNTNNLDIANNDIKYNDNDTYNPVIFIMELGKKISKKNFITNLYKDEECRYTYCRESRISGSTMSICGTLIRHKNLNTILETIIQNAADNDNNIDLSNIHWCLY